MKRAVCLSILSYTILAAAGITQPVFFARRDYPSATGYAIIADVNNDGIPDIVSVSFVNGIDTLLGNGNGTFRIGPNTGSSPIGRPVARDLNEDGNIDLVLATPSGIAVMFGNGNGTFQSAVTYAPAVGSYPIVADFNGDSIPDVVTSGAQGIWLYSGKGGGVFSQGVLVAGYPAGVQNVLGPGVAAADFNGDGNLDIVVTFTHPSGFLVYLGNGDGTFQTPVSYSGSVSEWEIAVGDLNNDGYPDIVLPGATVYLNNGKGSFSEFTKASLPGYIAIGDVNGDHIPDLVSSTGYVALGLGHGQFAPPVYYPVENSGSSYSVALGELRKKGVLDIVTGQNGAVSVLLNTGSGTFEDGEWTSVPGSGNCGAAADFNGDGEPDLAVPTTSGIVMLLGTGNASAPYTIGTTVPLSGPGCPITGDVNGDGIPDLLVGANSLGGVGVYLGNGDGTFQLASIVALGPSNDMVLGYFNNDGKLGIATSANQLALGNGDGTFQTPVAILSKPPAALSWIAAGDVNNDGWTDILAATDTRYGYVLLNNQHGGFTVSVFANDTPSSVSLADLNGDGNLDAVVATLSAYADVYLGDGKGGFKLKQSKIPYPSLNFVPLQVGDVNGDGIPDLLLPSDGSIGMALGNGNGTFRKTFAVGASTGLGQVLMQNLHGQSISSGLPDLVAPDNTGGVTVLLNLTK